MYKEKVVAITLLVLICATVLPLLSVPTNAVPDENTHIAAIESYIAEEMRANRIPGLSVGIVEDNEVVYLRGFGKADSQGRQITPQTSFIIGSMSKSFTALAIMQLVEAGKIKLDKPVQQYIPWFSLADPEASTQITVRNLLNQTSGISNIAGLRQCVGTGDKSIEQAVQELSKTELAHPAGTKFQYSNANYVVLGLLVEAVSGEPYEQYIRENIFEPLEMYNSFTSQTEATKNGMTAGYRRWFGLTVPSVLPYLHHGIPSGYIISSAKDMTHFLIANLNDGIYGDISILSPDGIAELHRPVAEAGSEFYGMGWVIGSFNGVPTIWHHGSTPNYHSSMLIQPEENRAIVVLTNVGLFEVWHIGLSRVIAEGIASILRDQSPSDYGSSIGTRYLIADIIIAVITALVILFIILLPRWRRRLDAQPPEGNIALARRIILPLVVDFSWPLAILIGLPGITHIPSWSFWVLYQPDLTYWLIAIASLTLFKAVTRLWLSYSVIRQVMGGLGGRNIILSAASVEVLFLALLFVVMFATPSSSTFVIGLMALALLFETIAYPVRLTRTS